MSKTIYIITHGTVLRKVGRRLLLEKKKQKLFEIPCREVGRILIYGRTEITSQTINGLLDEQIPLFFLRRSGRLKGKILPANDKKVSLRYAQYQKAQQPKFALKFARAIIQTKIQNMQTVIEYITQKSKGTAALCAPLNKSIDRLAQCQTPAEVMGVEGNASAHYFKIYGANFPPPFQFQIRTRRPATDPTNALLNLTYMTLFYEITAQIQSHSLDPYLGYLHSLQDGRPSLALDLLEEFRQPFADLFIMRLINKQQLQPQDFQQQQDKGTQMTDQGIQKFFRYYEQHMGQQNGDQPGLRKIISDKITALSQFIEKNIPYPHFQLTLEDNKNS